MKRIFCLFILFSNLISSSLFALPQLFTLDPLHTYVLWHINHFGFSNPSGKWMASGTLLLDKDNPQNSKVNVTVKISDMITGIDELNKHLGGADFFNITRYPIATFVSKEVSLTGKDTATVSGMLTIRGITKPIVLDVKLNKAGISPINNKETVGFSAKAMVKRSDFGMNSFSPGLGDNVKLDIESEAYKNASAPPSNKIKK